MKKQIGNKTTEYLCIFALVVWMSLIFYLSSQSASDSTHTSGFFVRFFSQLFGIGADKLFINIVRKSAHLFEFFILGVLSFLYISHKKIIPYVRILLSIGFCVLYSISDELHQLFVEGRACRITDVGIDAFGSTIGVLCIFFLIVLVSKFKKEKKQWNFYLLVM